METKQILVENLYKAAEMIILKEISDDVMEVKLQKTPNGWKMTITTEVASAFTKPSSLPRQMYKNVRLESRKKR